MVEVNGSPVAEVIRFWPSPGCYREALGGGWLERLPCLHVRWAGRRHGDGEPAHRGDRRARQLQDETVAWLET